MHVVRSISVRSGNEIQHTIGGKTMIRIFKTCMPGGAWYNTVALGVRNSFDSWKDCDTDPNADY